MGLKGILLTINGKWQAWRRAGHLVARWSQALLLPKTQYVTLGCLIETALLVSSHHPSSDYKLLSHVLCQNGMTSSGFGMLFFWKNGIDELVEPWWSSDLARSSIHLRQNAKNDNMKWKLVTLTQWVTQTYSTGVHQPTWGYIRFVSYNYKAMMDSK